MLEMLIVLVLGALVVINLMLAVCVAKLYNYFDKNQREFYEKLTALGSRATSEQTQKDE